MPTNFIQPSLQIFLRIILDSTRCIVGGYKSVLEKLYLPTIVSDLAEGSAYAGLCVEENHGQASAFLLKLQLDMQDICKKIAAESKDCFKIQKSKGIMNEMR